MKLSDELLSQGLISEKNKRDLEKELPDSGKTEEDLILEKNLIPEETLFQVKSDALGIPLRRIKPDQVPSDILEIMPEEASLNYKMTPFAKFENYVEIGMVYPEDISAQNALRFLANQEKFRYRVYLITKSSFEEVLKQRKTISQETKKALEQLSEEKGELEALSVPKNRNAGATIALQEEAPIIKMVLVVLRHAVEGGASDIHIEPGRDRLTVRFRLNGVLHSSLFLPLKVHPSVVARIKILSGLKIDETRVPQDGRFSARINNSDLDFRVSTFPTLYGEKIELRVLDSSKGMKSFEDLGLRNRNLEIVKEAIKKPYGLILSTGPTGSGKTTTQYAILKLLNKESVNIVTVEDPVEYSIPGINQSQVKPEIGYTFASGLRQILRQDPNVIMIGEIRDEETASLVVNAALTGHIVLSTLHTNSSTGVVPRLIDMGVRQFLIPSVLRVIVAQKLVRVLCSKCKIKIRPPEKVRSYILSKIKTMPVYAREELKVSEPLHIYQAKGCDKCNSTGYSGRIALFEVLSMSSELAELIQKNPLESLILKAARAHGMMTMEEEGIIKVLNGETTLEEVTRAVEERE